MKNNVTTIRGTSRFHSVFISDVHLGFHGCNANALLDFLESLECEQIYLVGDIIDFWALRKRPYWPKEHNQVVEKLLRMAEQGTSVYMVPGNHDEALRPYHGLSIGNVEVRDHMIHHTPDGRRLLVLHGDQFDSVVRCSPLLAVIGAGLYGLLLRLNTWVNRARKALGKDYWSLAAYAKHKVKNAVQYIDRYEEAVVTAARREGVDGVVCGHIHRAEITPMNGIEYMNCGDWVESCTALVEHFNGNIELVHWRETPVHAPSPDQPQGEHHLPPEGKAA